MFEAKPNIDFGYGVRGKIQSEKRKMPRLLTLDRQSTYAPGYFKSNKKSSKDQVVFGDVSKEHEEIPTLTCESLLHPRQKENSQLRAKYIALQCDISDSDPRGIREIDWKSSLFSLNYSKEECSTWTIYLLLYEWKAIYSQAIDENGY